MRAFGVPEVFLLVRGQDDAIVGDEVGDVEEASILALLEDGAWDDADIELPGKGAVRVEIFLGLGARGAEGGIRGDPAGEVVFREDGEVGTLGGGGADEVTCFGVVGIDLHGLWGRGWLSSVYLGNFVRRM